MSNLVDLIRDRLYVKVLEALPAFKKSSYQWDLTKNSLANHKNLVAIRPEAGLRVTGTNKTITIDHTFAVEFSSRFNKQGTESDKPQDDTVLELYEAHQAIYRLLERRNLEIQRVLLVALVDMEAPVIDNENGTVSITANYNVKYRTE